MRLQSTWRCARRLHGVAQKRHISDLRPFAEGDLVLLRQKQDRSAPPILSRPLKAGRRIEGHRGIIKHDDIIGSRVRDLVTSSTTKSTKAGTEYRLHNVTLEDYVRLSRRLVTPIYPADARLIVDLLDLHPDLDSDPQNDEEGESAMATKLEILEAGTGHGSLTLHLSRAIHGFNATRLERHAVLHTIDVSPRFSSHARAVVEGFRQGIYARNVDFHVGDVSERLRELQQGRQSAQFLSHALLDLPAAQGHLTGVVDALRVDGTLIVFNPSITQITLCATNIKDQRAPLALEKVVELGVNGGTGGREWDVRFVRPRSTLKTDPEAETEAENGQDSNHHLEGRDGEVASELRIPLPRDSEKWLMVCRPKVGDRIKGGGFLGVWKKQRESKDAAVSSEG